MLRSRCQVEPFERVRIVRIGTDIVGIVIVNYRMQHIDIHATYFVDDLHKAIQADPGIVVDRNTKILLDGLTTQIDATQTKRLIQLMHPGTRHMDIEVTRDREHANEFVRWINSDENIGLSDIRSLELLVGITPKQQNIDA